ncbi:hypothetical protein DL98DRAFT_505367, partial [Cadophora sp. DSE1049]
MSSQNSLWVDAPFKLIPVPGLGTPVENLPGAVFIAQDMACAHNGLLRSLNSIYLQAPFVSSPKDIKDFLLYTKFWCDWIEDHHSAEEKYFFPQVEEAAGVPGLMEVNINQHNAFMGGLEALNHYAKNTKVEDYDATKLRSTIDSFGHVFTEHLTDEIQTLLKLDLYDTNKMVNIYKAFEAEIKKGDKHVLFPMVLGSGDNSLIHWPRVPAPVPYLVHYIFEWKYSGAWRFSPSTTWGNRRPLAFTRN